MSTYVLQTQSIYPRSEHKCTNLETKSCRHGVGCMLIYTYKKWFP